MSKKNKRTKCNQANMPVANNVNEDDVFGIPVISAPVTAVSQEILQGIEMYSDYSCGASQGAVDDTWTCYYIDLQYANPYYINDWLLPHAFARRFVDAGMRVFLEDDGVMVACNLSGTAFDEMFESIIQPVLDEVQHGSK